MHMVQRGCSSVVEHNLAKVGVEGSNPLECAILKGPWTAIQVTVSKRLTFWNRSLMYHGVGKVADKLLTTLLPNSEVIVY